MINLGQDEIAKYPFLADAGQYLKDKGFTLEQFDTDPDLQLIIEKAYHRIEIAADWKIYKSDLIDDKAGNDATLPREVFSFLIAVVLLKLCSMSSLIQRFSLAEARRAEKYLEKDLANLSDKTKEELAVRIIKELFSLTVYKQNDYFTISVSDYLKHSINFHEREWKLVNRRVEKGMVHLTSHETVRLIRKELSSYITSKIHSIHTPPMSSGFKKPVEKLILLATFLLGKGQTVEQIAPLFKNAPDYNEKVTLYQLNHLAGSLGNATKYSSPSCDKVKSQNLCFAIPECDNIINPLQFGKKKTLNA